MSTTAPESVAVEARLNDNQREELHTFFDRFKTLGE